jgi:hypothetical protein
MQICAVLCAAVLPLSVHMPCEPEPRRDILSLLQGHAHVSQVLKRARAC